MADQSSEEGTVRYIRCGSCGTPNPGAPGAVCSRCGKPLHEELQQAAPSPRPAPPSSTEPSRPTSAPTMVPTHCPKCRKELPAGSKFCGFCGSPLAGAAPPASAGKIPQRQATPPVAVPRGTPKVNAPIPRLATPATSAPPPRIVVPAYIPASQPPSRPAAPPAAPAQGTQVFSGFRPPRIEASILEVKQDGTTGKSLRVAKETFIGRGDCDASYPEDPLLAPRHASVSKREGKLYLKDLGSSNGTFIKLRQDAELVAGDVFLLGRELFRFTTQRLDESPAASQGTLMNAGAPNLQAGPLTAKLEHIQLTGELIEEFGLDKPVTTIGRTTGDLVFKDDPYMSGSHARIITQPGRFVLQDLKSRNGVYRRIRGEAELRDADEFFLGEQLFRAEIQTITS